MHFTKHTLRTALYFSVLMRSHVEMASHSFKIEVEGGGGDKCTLRQVEY